MKYDISFHIEIEELATQVELRLVGTVRYRDWTLKTAMVDKSWLHTAGAINSDKLDLVAANLLYAAFNKQ